METVVVRNQTNGEIYADKVTAQQATVILIALIEAGRSAVIEGA